MNKCTSTRGLYFLRIITLATIHSIAFANGKQYSATILPNPTGISECFPIATTNQGLIAAVCFSGQNTFECWLYSPSPTFGLAAGWTNIGPARNFNSTGGFRFSRLGKTLVVPPNLSDSPQSPEQIIHLGPSPTQTMVQMPSHTIFIPIDANDEGGVVGCVIQLDEDQFVLIPAHAAIGTGPIPYPEPPDAMKMELNAIGPNLVAVGSFLREDAFGNALPRALWCSPTRTVSLDSLTVLPAGCVLTEAVDIRSNGAICCAIRLADGSSHTALLHDRRIDQNADGVINSQDVGVFLDHFAMDSQQADVNADEVLDYPDIEDFLIYHDTVTSSMAFSNIPPLDILRFLGLLAPFIQDLPPELVAAGEDELVSCSSFAAAASGTQGLVLTSSLSAPISPLGSGVIRVPQSDYISSGSQPLVSPCLNFPPMDPTTGYCGPSQVPAVLPASDAFNPCCYEHDKGYCQCAGKGSVDSKFIDCMLEKCPPGDTTCAYSAYVLYKAVADYGDASYCSVCYGHDPYCNGGNIEKGDRFMRRWESTMREWGEAIRSLSWS